MLQGSPDASEAPALDLHEGISGEAPSARISDPVQGCKRWPERMRLLSSQGELVRGRCHSTNLCDYCAKLGAVENSEMLSIDAMYGPAPVLSAVLTTRSVDTTPASFYESRSQLQAKLRKELPGYQGAWLLEMSSGYAPGSGGHRRAHWNLIGKTDQDAAAAAVITRQLVDDVWCRREDAHPAGQYVAPIESAASWVQYLALHFQKESQTPPKGWRGHRFTATRGYLWTDTPAARTEARKSLRAKREIWKALQRGLNAHDAELAAHQAQELADATTWRMYHLPRISQATRGGDTHGSDRPPRLGPSPEQQATQELEVSECNSALAQRSA
jgi:hypothetical protein